MTVKYKGIRDIGLASPVFWQAMAFVETPERFLHPNENNEPIWFIEQVHVQSVVTRPTPRLFSAGAGG